MDILVAVTLFGVVAMGSLNILLFIRVNSQKNLGKIDTLLTQTLGDRFLYQDLKNASPSFNNFRTPYNMDDSSRSFFDLNTTYPAKSRLPGLQTRTMTLLPGGKTEFFLLVARVSQGPPRYIDPVKLYDVSQASLSANGALTYVGPGKDDYFAGLNAWSILNASSASASSQVKEKFFVENSLLYFYAPSTARQSSLAADGFYQFYGFFGKVSGSSIAHETFGGRVQTTHLVNGDATDPAVTSLDDYLQQMPIGNGSIPIISARGVEFVRYYLDTSPVHLSEKALFKQKWDVSKGDFAKGQLIADRVESVILKRLSVSDVSISFDIKLKQVK